MRSIEVSISFRIASFSPAADYFETNPLQHPKGENQSYSVEAPKGIAVQRGSEYDASMDEVSAKQKAGCRLVVGVTGAIGAGVSTVSMALSEKGGFHQRRLSEAIRKQFLQEESRAKKTGSETPLLEQIKIEEIPN